MGGPRFLSDEWVPRREAWRLPVHPPALMSGPLPEDLMTDEDGEGFGGTGEPVPPPGEMPTTESIRARFHVPGVPPSGRAATGTDAEPGAEEGGAGGGRRRGGRRGRRSRWRRGRGGASPRGGASARGEEAPTERERRTRDMDAELGGRREELLAKLRKRTEEYNALIVDPRLRWELV